MSIKKASEVMDKAMADIERLQSGVDKPLKTRYHHLNENLLGGVYGGDVITFAATSGSGKSYTSQEVEEDFLNEELNPNRNVILLRLNWEILQKT